MNIESLITSLQNFSKSNQDREIVIKYIIPRKIKPNEPRETLYRKLGFLDDIILQCDKDNYTVSLTLVFNNLPSTNKLVLPPLKRRKVLRKIKRRNSQERFKCYISNEDLSLLYSFMSK